MTCEPIGLGTDDFPNPGLGESLCLKMAGVPWMYPLLHNRNSKDVGVNAPLGSRDKALPS